MSFFTSIGSFIVAVIVSIGGLFGVQATLQSGVSVVPADATPVAQTTDTAKVSPSSPAQQPDTAASTNTTASVQASAGADNLPAGSSWRTSLPLGDYKYVTDGPKKGYIYICHVATGGRGAEGSASWIHGSTWSPSEKVAVQGSVSWPTAAYSMSVSGGTRSISGNGLPTDHTTGTFPIQLSDPAHQYDGNPNSITAQSYAFSLPASPTALATPDCIFGEVGIMKDGVLLFDGFDATYRDAVAHETQDAYQAHPQSSGEYHYHGFESGFLNDSVSTVVGFAFDGFPITGGKLQSGHYLTTADLDECHGITSTIMLDGTQVKRYHYVLTQDFPYSVGCYKAMSHEPKPGGGAQAGQSQQTQVAGTQTAGAPPQGAIGACSGKTTNAPCSFSVPQGSISGTCRMPPNTSSLACVPN